MEKQHATLYHPIPHVIGEVRFENHITLCDYARSLGYEIGRVYSGLDLSYVDMIVAALEGCVEVIVTMELSPLLACTDLCEVLRPQLVSGDVHLITRDGLVNTVRDGAGMLGYYLWS